MKPTILAIAAALVAQSIPALAAEAPPLRFDLYVRGAFNGWGTDNQLAWKGKGVYETDILISPGNHAFKIGSKDWNAEWVANPSASVAVKPGAAYPLALEAGPEDYLFTKQTTTFRFRVDVSDPAKPVLSVNRVDTPAAGPAVDPHANAGATASLAFPTWDGKQETARFSVRDPQAPLRSYAHSTTMQLRDPGPQYTTYQEDAALPRVRSGNLGFDALFALAAHEMRLDSVKEIRDGNYNGNNAIPCDCFETGEKWHYVWTRDLSYAADLGLAMLDPQRVRNSLLFKLSGWRDGIARAPQVAGTPDGLQVVQDTGSGGSWPVSTDRITWAFAAEEVLKSLPPAERQAFAATALKALSNTIDNDRLAAFDKATGLYTGEESFLDWRDQSYAAWIPQDLASMASSKALSTNVGHYKALSLASQLAREQGDAARAARYAGWARELKRAINARLWLQDAGMYSSLTAAHFDGAPMHKFDWLGQSLAILTGVADARQARSILASYPHGPMGAPVIWPQQLDMPVYHNRAMWPFVTAYGLRAAVAGRNVAVADAAYDSLMRGAALNLSNMENLEWLSGQSVLLDEAHPGLIGPVINSKRQLWSVGAYLGMVVRNVFGVSTTGDGVNLQPFVTAKLRSGVFAAADSVTLDNLRLQGHRIAVTLRLPKAAGAGTNGVYAVERILLDGKPVAGAIPWSALASENHIEIVLGALEPGEQAIRRVNADPYLETPAVFGPHEPVIAAMRRDGAGHAILDIASTDKGEVRYNVYRDGRLVATKLPAGAWTARQASSTACYAVEAEFTGSGNRSHHSRPRCVDAGIAIAVTDARVKADVPLAPPNARFDEPHLAGWGKPQDRFSVRDIRAPAAGRYAVQVRYHNGANQVNLGISGGVKWLAVKDESGAIVAQGVVQLPHARLEKAHTPIVYSTPLTVRLTAKTAYRIEMSDFYNMSYLQSNSSFSAAGGVEGPSNRFDIYGVRLLRVR
ncbi:esterase [Massilia sp. WF1]|uniref:alpha-L-rhamnosidase-related protein n=1 Tax=unclassified Massilia TaxID=2609279 RepID=UPI00068F38F3|nr:MULTISPECIES: esterase [unclassified Massilia]ALK98704.1 esterase [Massilia sp. WG5]KNZ68098.1 esterase [Massilia sp. WF1]